MAQRVYVHIGAPKAGSTFLQERLFSNKEALAEQGICLPGKLIEHFQSKLFLTGQLEEEHGHPARANTAWERLTTEIREWDGTAILTHELFSGLKEEAVHRMLNDLAPAEVHVVYAARDLMRQIPAEWQEHIKHGWTLDFDEFVEDLIAEGQASKWFRTVQDPARVLERWMALPAEQRHVIAVSATSSDPDLLWDQFASVVGIDTTDLKADDVFSNESLGVAEAELLRRMNNYAVPRLLQEGRGQVPRWIKTEMAHNLLSQRPDKQRLAVPAKHREWVVRRSEQIVNSLQEAGHDVIGDLNDLIPSTLDQPEGDPAIVADDRLLDIALETLSELLIRLRRTTLELRENERRVNQLGRVTNDKEELAAEIDRWKARPVKQMLIETSERHTSLHLMRRGYWAAVNQSRKLKHRKEIAGGPES